MSPEEMKELIRTTINETTLYNKLIIAIVPVVLVMIGNLIYDANKRKKDFIKAYKIEQLKNLYLPLYSIISQSEYYKKINNIKDKELTTFYEFECQRTTLSFGTSGSSYKEEKIESKVTKFNLSYLVLLVIENNHYASIKLLKLAYSLNFLNDTGKLILKDKYDSEEKRIINNFIRLIIKETNCNLKFCKMEYDIMEMKKGIMNIKI